MVFFTISSRKVVHTMLGTWRNHADYRDFVIKRLENYHGDILSFEHEYLSILEKLFIFDLDPLKEVLAERYSYTGRPALNQPEFMRILILMHDLKKPVSQWINTLRSNFILRTACGLTIKEIPNISSLYAFIYRITGKEQPPKVRNFNRKPKFKLKKGEKLPPKHPNITRRLADKLIIGRRFTDPLADAINNILALVIKQSYALGLINRHINVSGDGTCIETGASPFGKKTCGCKSNGVFNCDCPRLFSDPVANWGWDSHSERPFYGYTGYFLSTHDITHKADLPLYLRIVDAKRHDSVSALVALAEFRDRYPQLCIDTFISDSASDNQATYELLDEWRINAVIALGKPINGKSNYPVPIDFRDATPICPAGHRMVFYGDGVSRPRSKWRCPMVLGKADKSSACDSCSTSPYGRTVYTKPSWDPRIFCNIPRGTDRWTKLMNERTAAERVNKRILIDYGVDGIRRWGKKRIAFAVLMAAINIHLDAQLKVQLSDYAARHGNGIA